MLKLNLDFIKLKFRLQSIAIYLKSMNLIYSDFTKLKFGFLQFEFIIKIHWRDERDIQKYGLPFNEFEKRTPFDIFVKNGFPLDYLLEFLLHCHLQVWLFFLCSSSETLLTHVGLYLAGYV